MHETNPANLQPRFHRTSRKLPQQLDIYPPAGASVRQLGGWLDFVESPIPIREERVPCEILEDGSLADSEKLLWFDEAMDEFGFEHLVPPDPVPRSESTEVRLVC